MTLKKCLTDLGVEHFEHIPLKAATSGQAYSQWLDKKQQASMGYMADHQSIRLNPQHAFLEMQSVLVVTQDYFPHPKKADALFPSLRMAHYAQGEDYHFWFKEILQNLIRKLQAHFPNESFLAFTDAVPLLERDLAAQAALGWIGKNTCLIHPKKGSLFFIGEILTSLNAQETPEPLHDFCGSCTACLDACPTNAFPEPRVLDANLCISYWNIESKKVPPPEIRDKIQDWFFGCDICQTVCPWNIKLHKLKPDFENKTHFGDSLVEDLKQILESSNKKLLKQVAHTPLSRAGGRGLKRNALIVVGNLRIKSLESSVTPYLEHPELGELAQWTLSQMKTT